jgi:hypothetical protein
MHEDRQMHRHFPVYSFRQNNLSGLPGSGQNTLLILFNLSQIGKNKSVYTAFQTFLLTFIL